MHGLTVVTLNTWKGDGAYRRRLDLMAEGLAALRPDILLLQECLAAPAAGIDTARFLADALGLHHEAWPGRRKRRMVEGRAFDCTSGVAVLARFPIARADVIALPEDPRDGARAALSAEIAHPAGAFLAVSLHLTHLDDATDLRRRQLAAILAALSKSDLPVLLGGDFNAAMNAPEFHDLPDGKALEDCRRQAGVPPQPTMPGPDAPCIDHILTLGAPWRARSVAVVLDRPDAATALLPSDPFGLSAAF